MSAKNIMTAGNYVLRQLLYFELDARSFHPQTEAVFKIWYLFQCHLSQKIETKIISISALIL